MHHHLKPLTLFCFISSLLIAGIAQASSQKDASEPAPISDREVVRYLSTPELLKWERAQEQLELGQSQVDSGNRLKTRPPSPLSTPQQIARDKQAGKEMVARGEAMVAQANQILETLRSQAQGQRDNQVVSSEPVLYPFEFDPVTLDEALMPAAEKILFKLWNQGYARIYLEEFFIIDTAEKLPVYFSDPVLSKELREDVARLDGNRFTFVNKDIDFTLVRDGNRNQLDFPGREATLRNFKSALVLAELVYDSRNESALLSLRGIDLRSGTIVAAEMAVLVVDESIRALTVHHDKTEQDQTTDTVATTDTTDAPESSEAKNLDISEAAESDSEAESIDGVSKRLAIQLRDDKDFMTRVSASGTPYIFTIEYVGDSTGFSSRTASIISKMILLQNRLYVSDSDFLKMAMGYGNDYADPKNDPSTNALWKVTPLGSSGDGRQSYDIQAVSLINSQTSSVPVGLMQTVLVQQDTDS